MFLVCFGLCHRKIRLSHYGKKGQGRKCFGPSSLTIFRGIIAGFFGYETNRFFSVEPWEQTIHTIISRRSENVAPLYCQKKNYIFLAQLFRGNGTDENFWNNPEQTKNKRFMLQYLPQKSDMVPPDTVKLRNEYIFDPNYFSTIKTTNTYNGTIWIKRSKIFSDRLAKLSQTLDRQTFL